MNIEELAIKTRDIQERMTADERLEFWGVIMQGYCRECGTKDPQGRCQCANDE